LPVAVVGATVAVRETIEPWVAVVEEATSVVVVLVNAAAAVTVTVAEFEELVA